MPGRKIKIVRYGEVASTNDVAKSLAWEGAEEGTGVLAVSQTKGRGRGGNTWVSPPGGLYLSLILRPLRRDKHGLLPLALAVAAARALGEEKINVSLKWPNDIILQGKKLGGVLAEEGSGREGETFVVNGIGLNINTPSSLLLPQAVSLHEATGNTFDIEKTALRIGEEFFYFYAFWQEGKSGIITKTAEACLSTLGRFVEAEYKGRKVAGLALALEEDGALVVRGSGGETMKLYSAFVRHLT